MTPTGAPPRVLLLTPDFPPAPGGIQVLLHRFATVTARVTVRVFIRGHSEAADWDRRTPEDPQAVADAVADLLLDPERARRLGAAGAPRAVQLSWSRMASQVEDVLLEVLDQ